MCFSNRVVGALRRLVRYAVDVRASAFGRDALVVEVAPHAPGRLVIPLQTLLTRLQLIALDVVELMSHKWRLFSFQLDFCD